MKLTGAQIMAEVLIEQGADTVFGYPGGAVLNIYDALYEYRDKIRHVVTAHEQGAAHAADGFARATGENRRGDRYFRPGRDKPCDRHCHSVYGQRADGGDYGQREHGSDRQRQLSGDLHCGGYHSHYQA